MLCSCIGWAPSVSIQASVNKSVSTLAVAFADVTGSGSDDPLVATSDGQLTRLTSCGNGCWQRGESVSIPALANLGEVHLATADFNGDHIQDVAVVSNGSAEVFFGGAASDTRTAGLVQSDSVMIPFGNVAAFSDVRAGDMNGDGNQDLAFLGGDPSLGEVYAAVLGDGHGNFATPLETSLTQTSRKSIVGFTLGDFKRDGVMEAAFTGGELTESSVSGFIDLVAAPGQPYAEIRTAAPLLQTAAGDVDGDGNDDLVVVLNEGNSEPIDVFRSNGAGGFTDIGGVTPGGSVGNLVVHDLDGDGKADILAVDTQNQRVEWWQGNGDGTFKPTPGQHAVLSHDAGPQPDGLALGTIAGHMLPDLLIGNDNQQFGRVTYLQDKSVAG
jgi:hypothetical protein